MAGYEWINGNPIKKTVNEAETDQDTLDALLSRRDHEEVATEEDIETSTAKAKGMLTPQSVKQALIDDELSRERYFNDLLSYEQTIQSNEDPLKKGGNKIGYRPDVIIFANRSQLSDEENILFDMASAIVSSKPDDEYYVIYPQDYAEDLPIPKNHFYEKLKKAAVSDTDKGTGINTKPLIFKEVRENPDNPDEYEERSTEIHMFDVMTYQSIRKKEGKKASSKDPIKQSAILFKPTKAMKALMISSTLTHGAHYNIMIPMGLTGYSKKMYYLLESRKNYKKYESAIEGVFEITMDEFRELLGIPESYNFNLVEKKILKKAQQDMAEIEGMPFNFVYEPVDGKTKSGQTAHVGLRIRIYDTKEMEAIPTKEVPIAAETPEVDPYFAEKVLIKGFGYQEKEVDDIVREYIKAERDIAFLSQALSQVKLQENSTNDKVALACYFMQEGFQAGAMPKAKKKTETTQRDAEKMPNMIARPDPNADYDALTEELLKGKEQ